MEKNEKRLGEEKKAGGLIFNLKLWHGFGEQALVKVPGYIETFTFFPMRKGDEEFSMLTHEDKHLTVVLICKERDAFMNKKKGTIIYKVVDGRNGPDIFYPDELIFAFRNDASRIFPTLHAIDILKSFGEMAMSARHFLPTLMNKKASAKNELSSFQYLKLSHCPENYLEAESFAY